MSNVLPNIFLWLVLVGTLANFAIPDLDIGAVSFKGLVWFVPTLFGFLVIANGVHRVRFPVKIWVPWIVVMAFSAVVVAPEVNFQYVLMLLSPLVVGIALSTIRVSESDKERVYSSLELYALVLAITCALAIGVAEFVLPEQSSHAAQLMTLTVAAAYFAVRFVMGSRSALILWLILASLSALSLSRMAAFATAMTLPLTLAPMSTKRRVLVVGLAGVVGLAAFYSDRFQQRFFFSGAGDIWDLSLDNNNLNTSGRSTVWNHLIDLADDRPWFGYGLSTAVHEVQSITYGVISHPHNDFVRLLFETGYVGLIVFTVTCLWQMTHAYMAFRRDRSNILLLTGASCFVPFFLYMVSDNVLLYAAFFGNPMFLLLGLGYALQGTHVEQAMATTGPISRLLRPQSQMIAERDSKAR